MWNADLCSFAPRDVPAPENANGLLRLFENFKIPSAFVAESTQNISQSFAAQNDIDGTTYVWFHFLCKTVTVEGNRIVHQRDSSSGFDNTGKASLGAQQQSQADFSWLKPGFVLKLKMRKQPASPRMASRTRTSSSEATMAPESVEPSIELFCFGAPASLGDRFRKLAGVAICDDIVQDPYVLLEVVLDEMYKVLDHTGWGISRVFGEVETVGANLKVPCSLLMSDAAIENPRASNDTWKSQRVASRPFHWSSQPR